MAQRSCAGCKKKDEKSEFIRLCMKGDKLIIDEKHSEDGRGAYYVTTYPVWKRR